MLLKCKKGKKRAMGKTRSRGGSKEPKEGQQRGRRSKRVPAPYLTVIGEVSLERFLSVREKSQNQPYVLQIVASLPNRHAF